MHLVDSGGWIEAMIGTPLGRSIYQPLLADVGQLVVPTIVQLECYKWVARELGEDAADTFVVATGAAQIVPLSTELAVLAASLSAQLKLAMADAIVLATARQAGARLHTSDAHFSGLPDVIHHCKT